MCCVIGNFAHAIAHPIKGRVSFGFRVDLKFQNSTHQLRRGSNRILSNLPFSEFSIVLS